MGKSFRKLNRLIEDSKGIFTGTEGPIQWIKRFLWDLQIPGSARAFDSDFYAMVYLMFTADEGINHDESASLRNMVRTFSRAGSRADELSIMDSMRAARASGRPFGSFVRGYKKRVHGNAAAIELAIEFLAIAAGSDGIITQAELAVLDEACNVLGFTQSQLTHLLARLELSIGEEAGASTSNAQVEEDPWRAMYSQSTRSEPQHPLAWAFRELECSVGSSEDTIKKSYRTLVMKFHPDRLTASEAPPEVIARGKSKFLQIQRAYEALESAGWK